MGMLHKPKRMSSCRMQTACSGAAVRQLCSPILLKGERCFPMWHHRIEGCVVFLVKHHNTISNCFHCSSASCFTNSAPPTSFLCLFALHHQVYGLLLGIIVSDSTSRTADETHSKGDGLAGTWMNLTSEHPWHIKVNLKTRCSITLKDHP